MQRTVIQYKAKTSLGDLIQSHGFNYHLHTHRWLSHLCTKTRTFPWTPISYLTDYTSPLGNLRIITQLSKTELLISLKKFCYSLTSISANGYFGTSKSLMWKTVELPLIPFSHNPYHINRQALLILPSKYNRIWPFLTPSSLVL